MSHRVVRGKSASGKVRVVCSDRYSALGIPRPKAATVCDGDCEGTGWIPLPRSAVEEGRCDKILAARWRAAERKAPAKDGWHFVKCNACGGTGRRS